MDAPKCRTCGERHWRNQPCQLSAPTKPKTPSLSGASETTKPNPASKPLKAQDATTVLTTAKPQPPEQLNLSEPASNSGPKAGYDRNAAHRAYMREYMRKRRAKEKK